MQCCFVFFIKYKNVHVCAKVNAKLKSVEEECQSLRRALSIEVDGRKELEGWMVDVL